MDEGQKLALIKLNQDFYHQTASYFSATRQNFWPGWSQLPLPAEHERVLDLACGNLRWKKFLDQKITSFHYLGLDHCQTLLPDDKDNTPFFLAVDLLSFFTTREDWRLQLPEQKWHYLFCSAFLHHIPSLDWQLQFLTQLVPLMTDQGLLVVSLWQFAENDKIQNKIIKRLAANDYILSWEAGVSAQRYCHSFTGDEIKIIKKHLQILGLKIIQEFRADGRSQAMNYYLVSQKVSWSQTKKDDYESKKS